VAIAQKNMAVYVAANWVCEHRQCLWLGCQNDEECIAEEAGTTCDMNTGFCRHACVDHIDCTQSDFRPDVLKLGDEIVESGFSCVSDVCQFEDSCTVNTDCTAYRYGRCRIPPGGDRGYCAYWPVAFCYHNSDCEPWESCRWDNTCRPMLTDLDQAAAGATCEVDRECQAAYLIHDMTAAGLSSAAIEQMEYKRCGQACDDDPISVPPSCGTGFACVELPYPTPYAHLARDPHTVCLPEACTADKGCGGSLAFCRTASDCPVEGEECTRPAGGCPGVCLELDCPGCAAWVEARSDRQCLRSLELFDAIRRDDGM
jgi:hypothetical protein